MAKKTRQGSFIATLFQNNWQQSVVLKPPLKAIQVNPRDESKERRNRGSSDRAFRDPRILFSLLPFHFVRVAVTRVFAVLIQSRAYAIARPSLSLPIWLVPFPFCPFPFLFSQISRVCKSSSRRMKNASRRLRSRASCARESFNSDAPRHPAPQFYFTRLQIDCLARSFLFLFFGRTGWTHKFG